MTNWAHLSNISSLIKKYEGVFLIDQLIKYLKDQPNPIDYVIITGSLFDKERPFKKEIAYFFNALTTRLQIHCDNVHIVPGQSDFSRSPLNQWQVDGIYSPLDNAFKTSCIGAPEIKIDLLEDFFKKGKKEVSFFEFLEEIKSIKYSREKAHFIEERSNYNILNMNTCVYMGREEKDLIVGQVELYDIDKIFSGSDKLNIAIGYHDIDCFMKKEREFFVTSCRENKIPLYFCSKSYTNDKVVRKIEDNFYVVSNCKNNESNLCFSTGVVDEEKGQISFQYHRWSDEASKFIKYLDIDNGLKDGQGKIEYGKEISNNHEQVYLNSVVKVEEEDCGEIYHLGSGFFIGSKHILTCAHLFTKGAQDPLEEDIEFIKNAQVRIFYDKKRYNASVKKVIVRGKVEAAVLEIIDPSFNEGPKIPVLGDDNIKENCEYMLYGHPNTYPEGQSTTCTFTGISNLLHGDYLLNYSQSQIHAGYSGAPILNKNTNKICAMIKTSKDENSDLGGRAIPISLLLNEIKEYRS